MGSAIIEAMANLFVLLDDPLMKAPNQFIMYKGPLTCPILYKASTSTHHIRD